MLNQQNAFDIPIVNDQLSNKVFVTNFSMELIEVLTWEGE